MNSLADPAFAVTADAPATRIAAAFARIPHAVIALLGRVSIAATFWMSGQTKTEGFVLDPVNRTLELGWPRVSADAIELFRSEYMLPLLPPAPAATLAAISEHVFPLLLLVGLASRLSAFALLVMTAVIQVFVYPAAFATHGVWAAVLLYVMAHGPGRWSLDAVFARRRP